MKNGTMGILNRTKAPKFGVVTPTMKAKSSAKTMDMSNKGTPPMALNTKKGPERRKANATRPRTHRFSKPLNPITRFLLSQIYGLNNAAFTANGNFMRMFDHVPSKYPRSKELEP